MQLTWTVRTYPAGTPAAGLTVSLIREADDTVLDTATTDANGRVTFTRNGSPGPVRLEVTDTAADPDVTRITSSRSTGSGGSYALAELPYALRALGEGVIAGYLDALEVTYDGAGLDLDVAAGGAVCRGVPAIFGAATDLTSLGTRDATNPKACYVVVEVSPPGQSDEGRSEIKAVCGTAAASPALPALVQDETLWQEPLATYTLPNTGSTTLTGLADARRWLGERRPVVSSVVRRTDPTSETTTTSTSGEDVSGLTTTVTLLDGVVYDLEARCLLTAKAGAGQTVSVAPYLNGAGQLAEYVSSDAADFTGLGNAHTLAGVVGSGAAIACGVRWKVDGGTATASTGYLLVTATPRS